MLIGNAKALRELPYSQIKYVHYFNDGTYQPYEYSGNIIEIADACFNQLKSEIRKKEVHFGLFHDFIDDYSEIVLRELLINAIVHRDYSRQQIIEIRKYQSHIEFESPGTFPQGIDVNNYLRKTNSRNPNIIDIFRAIRYAEKAGSGMDKVFTDLLSKGKKLPMSKETDDSVTFTVESEIYSDKIIELSMAYKKETGIEMDMDRLLVLNLILSNKKMSYQQLENSRYISASQLKVVLDDLLEREFVEITGKTSGQKYIIHKSRAISTDDKINYAKSKKQEKASQKEAIIRYLNEFETITNAEARKLLKLPDSDMEYISRLFAEMVKSNLIKPISAPDNYKRVYSIVQK